MNHDSPDASPSSWTVSITRGACLVTLLTRSLKRLARRCRSAVQETGETLVHSLAQEGPLERGLAPHSRILRLENPMGRGAWPATARGVAETWTRLSE